MDKGTFAFARSRVIGIVVSIMLSGLAAQDVRAMPPATLDSVVSVLPVWPDRPQGGGGAPPGVAPEGSGVILRPGVVATAWHVIEPAERIDVRLADGRVLPARLIAFDAATDIAVLSVDVELAPFEVADRPVLAERVCAIGNAWGLGLSVTCGVVSALDVTDAGFHDIEHFVQTDAAANPGASGGALVDAEGHLVGMISAIFASQGDTNIGVNFAVSVDLLLRVANALLETGTVTYPDPGWDLSDPSRDQLIYLAAPVVSTIAPKGNASLAGIRKGDRVMQIEAHRIKTPRDAIAALALVPESATSVDVGIERAGQEMTVTLPLALSDVVQSEPSATDDCPHPAPVCQMRQAVFPISSFDPVGSATRIGHSLLVTNRHVVGNRSDAVIHTPNGPSEGRVLPSAYTGDLVLIEVDSLPEDGMIITIEEHSDIAGQTYAIGADLTRRTVRVFDPGTLLALPAEGAELGRLHVTSYMQPGVSGGALVDDKGTLVGINVGGGEGRYEAIPVDNVRDLIALTEATAAMETTLRLGTALADCVVLSENTQPRTASEETLEALAERCAAANNHGQFLEAGRLLATAGDYDAAIALHGLAVEQVPNSINARVSLLVSLQLAARFEEMTDHARKVMEMVPDDPQILRFAIQSGVWGGAPELAEAGYAALLKADPQQAQAARRFIDSAPPAPVRR